VRAAREWRLPPEVADVIRAHHGAAGEPGNRALVALVQTVDAIVAVIGTRGSLGDDELAAVPGLARGEAARVLAALPGIVEMVASFSQPARLPSASAPSFVEPERCGGAGARVDFPVSCERKDAAIVYAARSVDWEGLRVAGRQALPENCLVKITLHLQAGDLPIWMTVADSSREGSDYVIELRPYAIHGDARAAYHAMVTHAFRAAS
jgi:hypothetical protein